MSDVAPIPVPGRSRRRSARERLRRLRGQPLLSPRQWLRQFIFWFGAVIVALIAIAFADLANGAVALCDRMADWNPYVMLVVAPGGLVASVLLTRRVFPGAQGSGIPQTIAALQMADQTAVNRVLSLRLAGGKMLLTLFGLLCGASIGREGPTVQVGATVMHAFGRFAGLPRPDMRRALILAGGAAGIAGAFNTPLAGIVFAIEELAHSFEERTSGTVLTAVIITGITTLALVGNYTYFGHTSAKLDFGVGWWAVIACGVSGGLAGGLFAVVLVTASRGLPGWLGRFVIGRPVLFAASCGLLLALIGLAGHGDTYGTGYAQARALIEGKAALPGSFFVLKLLATMISYVSGIPGGLFSPSLAVGAGLGSLLSGLMPQAPSGAVVLLGMVAYFAGAVQSPITSIVIVTEMTDNQQMTVPLMATAVLAYAVSRLLNRRPLYSALSDTFLAAQEHRPSWEAAVEPGTP